MTATLRLLLPPSSFNPKFPPDLSTWKSGGGGKMNWKVTERQLKSKVIIESQNHKGWKEAPRSSSPPTSPSPPCPLTRVLTMAFVSLSGIVGMGSSGGSPALAV